MILRCSDIRWKSTPEYEYFNIFFFYENAELMAAHCSSQVMQPKIDGML